MEWSNLAAALLGGVFSLAGSYFSTRWQFKRQEKLRQEAVYTFCIDLISHLAEVIITIDSIFKSQSTVWFEGINQIDNAMAAVNRNFENLAFVRDEGLRSRLRNFFHQVSSNATRARFWQNQVYESQKKIDSDVKEDSGRQKNISNEITQFNQNAKECIIELRGLAIRSEEVRRDLQDRYRKLR